MKRSLLTVFLIGFAAALSAQNIQLHYDLGKDRGYFTSTIEMFKPDKTGNTFFFVDFDYGAGDVDGVSLAYLEIARCFTIGKSPWSWHAEYNGGFGQFRFTPFNGAYSINNAWLTGLDYSWNAPDFSKGFSVKTLYKYIDGKHDASFQLTGVWYYKMLNNKLLFTGFADFWREDNYFGAGPGAETTRYVFLAEPQLWYNFAGNFKVGGEIELSNNFAGMKGFNVMPTLGLRYDF
jgi:hypothetical protein